MLLVETLTARGVALNVDRRAHLRGQPLPERVVVDTVDPMSGSDLLAVAMFAPVPAAVAITATGRVWVLTGGETGRVVVEYGAPDNVVDTVADVLRGMIPGDAANVPADPAGSDAQTIEPDDRDNPASEAGERPKRRRKTATVDVDADTEEDPGAPVES